MPCDRAVIENEPSIILQPKSAWCVLFGGVWRKSLEISRGEGKAYVMALRHACRSAGGLGKQLLFLLDNMALVLGASKVRGSMPNLNHTCREICVISLATFIIPICRWIASEDNPADETSRSKRYRPSMCSDVDLCRPSATALTRSCLPSSQPKPQELPVKKRKLESHRQVAPALVSPTKIEEGWKQVRRRREERGRARARAHLSAASLACQHPLFGKSSFLEQNRVTAATVQRYTLNEFLAFAVTGKVGRDGGGNAGTHELSRDSHGAGDYLMAAISSSGGFKISPIFPAPHER